MHNDNEPLTFRMLSVAAESIVAKLRDEKQNEERQRNAQCNGEQKEKDGERREHVDGELHKRMAIGKKCKVVSCGETLRPPKIGRAHV